MENPNGWRVGAVNDNHSHHLLRGVPLRLDQLPHRQASTISAIDWESLDTREARRLQELGFVEGVTIEALHRGPLKDPIACRVGSMTIALRRALAAAITVEPVVLAA